MHSSLPSSSSAASSPPLPSAVADSPGHHRPPATAFMLEQQREMQTQLQHFVQGQLALQQLDERFASTQSAASFSVAAPGLFSPSSAQHSSSCPSREATEEQGGEPATGSTLLASAFLLDQAMASVALSPVPSANIGPPSVEEEEEAVKANGEEEQGREEVNDKNGKAEEQTGRTMRENGEEIAKEPEERDQNGDEVSPPPQNSDANEQQSERRTTELIRKQLAEIEREIARRMQNKNVKKMDEQEMSQLLLDHGFSIRLGQHHENGNGQQSALPFPSDGGSRPAAPVAPNLDQLRQSSLSGPPSSQAQQPMYFPQPFPAAQFAHPQGPFLTQICPQEQFAIPQPFVPAAQFYQFAPNAFSAPFLPQQNAMAQQTSAILHPTQSPSPPFAQMLPPSMSAITPEMAAALLAQLQQHNPALLQNLVDQQQCQTGEPTNSISATAPPAEKAVAASDVPSALPAPPRGPQCSIAGSRRESAGRRLSATNGGGTSNGGVVGHMRRQNSAEWTDEKRENNDNKAEPQQPVWLMRESFLKRKEREEQRRAENGVGRFLADEGGARGEEQEEETDKLLLGGAEGAGKVAERRGSSTTTAGEENGGGGGKATRKGSKKEVIIHEPAVLIEGVLFRARYLGSTQMSLDGRPTKSSRMAQAQEAVARVKAPEGELQPSTEIDLFISTEKIMVLNTDLQRISETDVRQDILMDHALRSISYIADIGDLVVLMARRVPNQQEQADEENEAVRKAPRVICHVFESDESAFIAQSIGQAFQVAYVEFLRANGIEDPNYLRDIDYQEVLNSQELLGEELELLARKETQKDVVVAKKSGEALGVVVVESGWGSMLPTVVIANMAPGGAAARSNQLNIGDQIIGINGISLVGLPLSAAQTNIKNARSSTAVRLTVVSTPPVVEVRIRRPDTKYQLGFSVQNGVICSLLRGGIAERGGIRVGHRIIEINHQSVVAVPHERIVNMLATATGEIHMKTMPTSMFRLLTGQEVPNYI